MTLDETIKILEDMKVDIPVPKAAVTQIKRNIALDMAVDALSNCSEFPNNWIPCSERLPEEKDAGILKKLGVEKKSEHVLATVEVNGERMTVTACTYDGKWDWNMKYAFPDFKIIAWMPLPKPWRVEEHESH